MLAGRSRFRSLLLCGVLQLGVMCGVPMRPDEIEKLMRSLSTTQVAQTLPDRGERGGAGGGGGDAPEGDEHDSDPSP